MQVGVRDLKTHLSAHLDRVKAGQTITVTAHGRPVARLVPVDQADIPPDLAALIAAGKLRWSGRKLRRFAPLPVEPGTMTIAQMVSEDRR
jgi:prevent-host-death family protein